MEKLSHRIFITLRDRITYLEYPPEMVLPEKKLCEEFKVSRSPLRIAILMLEEMNYVKSMPRYGTFINHVDINENRHTYEVKMHLDALAGFLAAQRITDEQLKLLKDLMLQYDQQVGENRIVNKFKVDFKFHEIIYKASGNPVLEKSLVGLLCRCLRFCLATMDSMKWEESDSSVFIKSYEALMERDPKKASEAAIAHNQEYIDLVRSSSFSPFNMSKYMEDK